MDDPKDNESALKTDGPLPTLFLKVLSIRAWPASILGICLLQAILTALNLPSWNCLFYKATGYSCPGCGMSRSMASLFKADFAASWSYHPFAGLYVVGAALLMALICLPKQPRLRFLNVLRAIDTRSGITVTAFGLQVLWGLWRMITEITGSGGIG